MRIFLLILFICCCFCYCNDISRTGSKTNTNSVDNNKPTLTAKIDKFVEAFIIAHPNWGQNDVINKQTDKIFKDSLIRLYKSPGTFDDYVFKFDGVNEYSKGKYAAKFVGTEDKNSSPRKISVEIVGLVSNSMVNKLINNQTYFIDGKFIKFLDHDLENYYNYSLFNVSVGFEQLVDNTYFLGTALVKINDIRFVTN